MKSPFRTVRLTIFENGVLIVSGPDVTDLNDGSSLRSGQRIRERPGVLHMRLVGRAYLTRMSLD